jgi:rubrerythrin
MDAQQENELTDIALCYQALGVPLDASPVQIDRMYQALTEENKKKLGSPDPADRAAAKQSQDLVDEMYDKIRGSITYHAMEKDYLKRSADQAEAKVKRPVHQAVVEKSLIINCPRCNGSIRKGLKVCPICRTPIYTTMQKIVRTYFTPKMLIIYFVVLAVAALAVVAVLHPELYSSKKPESDILQQISK